MKTPERKDRRKALAALKEIVPSTFIPEMSTSRGNGVQKAVIARLEELKNGQSLRFDLDIFGIEVLYRAVRDLNKSPKYVTHKFHATKYTEKNCMYIWLQEV